MIAVLLALTQIVVVGLPAALLLDRREAPSRGRLLGASFLLGSGIVWLVLLAISSAGVVWSRVNVTAAILLVAIALWIAAWKVERAPAPPASRATWIDLATLAFLAIHGFLATRKPVGEWDFWAIWGLKARAFYEHGAIDWTFLRHPYNSFQHPDYPLLVPLNYVFVAVHGGAWSDRWLGLTTTLFAAALVLIVRDQFARELPRTPAALATLGVAAIAASSWVGMAEAPMIAYGSAGLLLLRQRAMPLGAVLLGLAACTKNEGLALIAATGGALLLAGRARDILRLWPAAVIAAPWLVLRALYSLQGEFYASAFDLTRVGPILLGMVQYPPERPLLWVALAAAFVLFIGPVRRERFVLLACLLQVLSYLYVYLVTPHDVRWHISYSWTRLLDQVAVPLAFVALTITGRRLRVCGWSGGLSAPPGSRQSPPRRPEG